MRQFYILVLVQFIASVPLWAQEMSSDTAKVVLSEVIVISKKAYQKQAKPLATVDEYLSRSGKVEMIRRGNYAWEPIINGMATERTVVTIDGMRIFGACTDKMDPVTSYVEVSNLSEAGVSSGQQGNCHGTTIGGSVDLKRSRYDKAKKGWATVLNTGFETNASQKIIGGAVTYADPRFYTEADFTSRNAENYKAGDNREVLFSRFSKFNLSGTSGIRLGKNKLIEASVIYDKATDVGYPGLPMDVSLAEALITAVKFDYRSASSLLKDWETKIYFNTVTHRMDDTKRPNVAVHMDMPGWSDTYGFYTTANGAHRKHHFTADLNSFYNRSRAQMTMYPQDPDENLMFMDTWPDVRTVYASLFLKDEIAIDSFSHLKISATMAHHSNTINSTSGLQSLQIFYPGIKDYKARVLKSFSGHYTYSKDKYECGIGVGYGERAPSVSEGYGFYLFNSFDRYDYIGNPELHNECSLEASLTFGYKSDKASVKWSSSWFRIADYIVAIPDQTLLPMTIGAAGVKRVTALSHADIANAVLDADYWFLPSLKLKTQLVYNYGRDKNDEPLPFISPLRYNGSLHFKKGSFSTEVKIEGNAVQRQYSPSYGEDKTPAYAVLGTAVGYGMNLKNYRLDFNGGVENILDAYYSTFSDWNNIPRKGRNFFLNVAVHCD